MPDGEQPPSTTRQRIDKWLFFARMTKSRSLAQVHVQNGHVRVNGERVLQPSYPLKTGDRVDLTLERRDIALIVRQPGVRRGPFEEAKLLYEDVTPPADEAKRMTRLEQALRAPATGRRQRREINKLLPDDD
jgi:ribosome-associated heat shock protein Hsp15